MGPQGHEADFNVQLASMGTAPGKALALQNKFYEGTFKALLPPQQKLWIDRAAKAHKEAKEAIKQYPNWYKADTDTVAFHRVTKCFQDYLETCYSTVPGAAVTQASNIDPGPAAHKHTIPKGRHKRAKGGIESKVPTKCQRCCQSSSKESFSNNSTDSDDSHESVPTKVQCSQADDPHLGDLAYARRCAIQNKQQESRNRAKKHVELCWQSHSQLPKSDPPALANVLPPSSVVSSSNSTSDGNPTSYDVMGARTPVDGNAHETTSEAERLVAVNTEEHDNLASEDAERSTAITIESQTDTDIQNPWIEAVYPNLL
ncbi:hypothetical protein IMY05_C4721000100 [Salix suchowensis]|nr:hypothetical protein IMY05_C4721000100 [Salix suchowensis]